MYWRMSKIIYGQIGLLNEMRSRAMLAQNSRTGLGGEVGLKPDASSAFLTGGDIFGDELSPQLVLLR